MTKHPTNDDQNAIPGYGPKEILADMETVRHYAPNPQAILVPRMCMYCNRVPESNKGLDIDGDSAWHNNALYCIEYLQSDIDRLENEKDELEDQLNEANGFIARAVLRVRAVND